MPDLQHTPLNAAMEALIRTCPEQYLWGYARYKTPPSEQQATK
jgi:KDO2-lipid IV(A) lauroyltransferase